MGWKESKPWEKGIYIGIIVSIFFGIFVDIAVANFSIYTGFGSSSPRSYIDPTVLSISFMFTLISLLFTISVGALIGFIIGKIKSKK